MKIVFCLLSLITVAAFAQDPANVLIYHDISGGYGNAVVTAAGNLWPSANIESYDGYPGGQQVAFNTALSSLGDAWDIVVIESWYANANTLNWAAVNDLYDTGAIKLFASTWQWTSGTAGQGALGNAMGVSGFSGFGSPVIPHYCWNTGHAIADGITDWAWNDPGLLTLNSRMTVSTATPVTGWTSSSTSGQAAICVASDGCSVISGFTPAYANESIAIWENILGFMWGDTSLERETWAGIKASF
ncbi:MAG: hypothetical protein K8S62_08735 [Candidatus Sabulitectum sp.]|nr:hypothetical protein [Candidatus Sabulitectum sp.]